MDIKRIGKLLIAYLFIASAAYEGIFGFTDFVDLIKNKGLPFPLILAILAITVKILGGFSIALDIYPKIGTIALIVFMLIVTPIYHNGFAELEEMDSMLKNIAIIGGLLLIW